MQVVVISVTPYKEKDGIVNAVSSDETITFLVRGLFSPNSKNAALNTNLVIADIELQEGNFKYPVLKSSNIVSSPMKVTNDYYYLGSLMVITEATKNLLQDEEKVGIYQDLIDVILTLKNTDNPWMPVLIYMAKIFKISGYEFEVNRCVFCGSKKDIKTFSFRDGRFVCGSCLHEDTERDFSKEQMLLVREVFNSARSDAESSHCTKENALFLFNKFIDFISDSYGFTLKTAALLNK
jgi:DNA repair protein RecO